MSKPALPRAVIFDWDNTLVDSWDAIMNAMNATLAHYGMPPWSMEETRHRCTLAAKDYFPAIFGAEWQKAFDFYYRAFDVVRSEHSAKPLRGSGDLLRWLKDRNIPAFVVSNKSTRYLKQESDALDWTKFFVALIGAQDVTHNKPARDAVDLALSKNDMKADDPSIWFVGDTNVDMQCARNSGCTPVFVGEAKEAKEFGIAMAFADCQGLHDWLNTL